MTRVFLMNVIKF